jgi:hypothetical protein
MCIVCIGVLNELEVVWGEFARGHGKKETLSIIDLMLNVPKSHSNLFKTILIIY